MDILGIDSGRLCYVFIEFGRFQVDNISADSAMHEEEFKPGLLVLRSNRPTYAYYLFSQDCSKENVEVEGADDEDEQTECSKYDAIAMLTSLSSFVQLNRCGVPSRPLIWKEIGKKGVL